MPLGTRQILGELEPQQVGPASRIGEQRATRANDPVVLGLHLSVVDDADEIGEMVVRVAGCLDHRDLEPPGGNLVAAL